MGKGFDPTWLRQVIPGPLLHKTTLTTGYSAGKQTDTGEIPMTSLAEEVIVKESAKTS